MTAIAKRIFLIVLDSLGVGALDDARDYGDDAPHTLGAVAASGALNAPALMALGLGNIAGANAGIPAACPAGAYGRLAQRSRGKDTTTGHWELAGLVVDKPFPTYPQGFPAEIMGELARLSGRGALCNRPYSGTQVLADYGQEHINTGKLIVYTSADSVLQIAAHLDVVPLGELYRVCEGARSLLVGRHAVGRVIARPFTGSHPNFTRTSARKDYALPPPGPTMLDVVKAAGMDVLAVGKIDDIFAHCGPTRVIHTKGNHHGMRQTMALAGEEFTGLCFVNLVDFDMLYGHRRDARGYAMAVNAFDTQLNALLPRLGPRDVLMITADHGCDPSAPGSDHTREYAPILVWGGPIIPGVDLKTRQSFADVAATCLDMLGMEERLAGDSFALEVTRGL